MNQEFDIFETVSDSGYFLFSPRHRLFFNELTWIFILMPHTLSGKVTITGLNPRLIYNIMKGREDSRFLRELNFIIQNVFFESPLRSMLDTGKLSAVVCHVLYATKFFGSFRTAH